MKNKEMRMANLKYQLLKRRNEGQKFVTWELNPIQKDYIEGLGYYVEEYLYKIYLKKIPCTFNKSPSIIKEIMRKKHSNLKNNYYVRTLKKTDRQILKEYGVKFEVKKYRIYLL